MLLMQLGLFVATGPCIYSVNMSCYLEYARSIKVCKCIYMYTVYTYHAQQSSGTRFGVFAEAAWRPALLVPAARRSQRL